MARRFDTEDIFRALIAFVKVKINPKLAEIRTEKGITTAELKDVNTEDDAFVFLTMNDGTPNRDVWVLITQADNSASGIGPSTAKTESIAISIIFSYQNNLISGYNALRYRRALREIFEDDWDRLKPHLKMIVKEDDIFPVFEADPSEDEEKMVLASLGAGVTIDFNFAT